jgi:hypothetical protein
MSYLVTAKCSHICLRDNISRFILVLYVERKSYSKKIKKLPKGPPLHDEPLRGIEPGKLACQICGKAFAGKSQLDRHMLTVHESPEGRA